MIAKKPTDIDAYIAAFPEATQLALEQVRASIRKASPAAVEAISYSIPCFKLNGTFLIYFAGFKGHIGVYPLPKGDMKLQKAIAPYIAGKGTLRFPLDKRMPLALIAQVVKQHVKENTERATGRAK